MRETTYIQGKSRIEGAARSDEYAAMNVVDFMTRKLVTAGPAVTVPEAARLMLEHRISALPVIDDGALVGLVTEADLLRRTETETEPRLSWWQSLLLGSERLTEQYVCTHGRTVGEIMRHELVSIAPSASLAEAIALMESRAVKRLLVLEDGRLVGILSRADLLRALEQLLSRAAAVSSAEASADVAIRRRILGQLAHWAPAAILDIRVSQGTVEICGLIFEESQREALRVLTESTPGVRAVVDRLVKIEAALQFN